MDVVDEHAQAGQPHRLGDAEFIGRLDSVGRVGARIGQGQDLRLAALRLQQEGRKVTGSQRMLDRPHHLAAARLDHLRRIGLQRVAEGVA
ncbi:hypothetical protein G6F45_013815 [Rhizopus arrhizus]|nr:hypothetical protein G6F45_013815 [Rhizopus arrhizus]